MDYATMETFDVSVPHEPRSDVVTVGDRTQEAQQPKPVLDLKKSPSAPVVTAGDPAASPEIPPPAERPARAKTELADLEDVPETPKGAPSFPELSYNPPVPPDAADEQADEGDEEPPVATSFERGASPVESVPKNRTALYERLSEDGIARMHKFSQIGRAHV